MSCDDAIQAPIGDTGVAVPVHSSIVLDTTGTVLPPQLPTQLFTCQEVSVPILEAPARGFFEGVTRGQILVEGAFYVGPDLLTTWERSTLESGSARQGRSAIGPWQSPWRRRVRSMSARVNSTSFVTSRPDDDRAQDPVLLTAGRLG
jgi:hypothetical protein